MQTAIFENNLTTVVHCSPKGAFQQLPTAVLYQELFT